MGQINALIVPRIVAPIAAIVPDHFTENRFEETPAE